jgi:hypothetical protein
MPRLIPSWLLAMLEAKRFTSQEHIREATDESIVL